MRIGGAFTFGQVGVPIGLAAGEVYYIPPGNYYFTLGNQTVIQYLDPINAVWRNIAWPGGSASVLSPDGYNYRMVNMSGVCQGALITAAGTTGTNGIGASATGTTVTFGAVPTNGVVATAYPIIGGKLLGLTVTAGGSAFVMPPRILIDPPPFGGIQATATCTISGGIINTVTLQNPGAGYLNTPNVYIVPAFATYPGVGQPINATPPISIIPPGVINSIQPPFLAGIAFQPAPTSSSGAQITCTGLTGSGTLTGIVMTNYGVGYTGLNIPTVLISGGTLTGATATAIMSFCVTAVGTAGLAGSGYTIGAPWESSIGLVATTDGCNNICGSRPARGTINSLTGFTTTAATIEDPGYGLQKVPVASILPFTTTPASGLSTTTLAVGGQYDISVLQQAVED
jgi:hypothetical protein